MTEAGIIPRLEQRDPYVRVVDVVADAREVPLRVGVDHGTVTLGFPGVLWRFGRFELEELCRALAAAGWVAAGNQARLDAEAGGG